MRVRLFGAEADELADSSEVRRRGIACRERAGASRRFLVSAEQHESFDGDALPLLIEDRLLASGVETGGLEGACSLTRAQECLRAIDELGLVARSLDPRDARADDAAAALVGDSGGRPSASTGSLGSTSTGTAS